MDHETIFTVDTEKNPLLKPWLMQQFRITSSLMKAMKPWHADASHPCRKSPTFFGEPQEIRQNAVNSIAPDGQGVDVAPLSSYINYGMAGISLDTLFKSFTTSMRYRSSNARSIVQYPMADGGSLYASGVPGNKIPLVDAEVLPDIPIAALIFTIDPAVKLWTVTVVQRFMKPRKPRSDKKRVTGTGQMYIPAVAPRPIVTHLPLTDADRAAGLTEADLEGTFDEE